MSAAFTAGLYLSTKIGDLAVNARQIHDLPDQIDKARLEELRALGYVK